MRNLLQEQHEKADRERRALRMMDGFPREPITVGEVNHVGMRRFKVTCEDIACGSHNHLDPRWSDVKADEFLCWCPWCNGKASAKVVTP